MYIIVVLFLLILQAKKRIPIKPNQKNYYYINSIYYLISHTTPATYHYLEQQQKTIIKAYLNIQTHKQMKKIQGYKYTQPAQEATRRYDESNK